VFYIIAFCISIGACIAGAICGIGGGILMKPILDMTGLVTAAEAGFLSGGTVLVMSLVSLYRRMHGGKEKVAYRTTTILAIGAVIGGLLGKSGFDLLREQIGDAAAGRLQAGILLALVGGTMLYTLLEHRIKTKQVKNAAIILLAGLFLGAMSSFLGLGGGPFNLVVLSFLFGMGTKEAGLNSLYIITFSQLTSIVQTIVTGRIPAVDVGVMGIMIAGGILGGIIGSELNKKMAEKQVRILLLLLMVVIMGICIINLL
jgi:uncharacterized membrane protein YfcA